MEISIQCSVCINCVGNYRIVLKWKMTAQPEPNPKKYFFLVPFLADSFLFPAKLHLSISGVMAFNITIINLFPIWRTLISPVFYPALVALHYIIRSIVVSYISLATACGLVQLGLLVSFEWVVGLREERVVAGVAAGTLIITMVHFLVEAVTRNQMGLWHISRSSYFFWLAKGKINPSTLNKSGTGFLILPHLIFLILINIAVFVFKFRHRHPQIWCFTFLKCHL